MNTINAGAFNLNLEQFSPKKANLNNSTKKALEGKPIGSKKFKEAIESILKKQAVGKTDKVDDKEIVQEIIEELSQLLNIPRETLMALDELNFKKIKDDEEINLLTLLKTESEEGKETLNIIFGDAKDLGQGIEKIAKISLEHNKVKSQDSTQQLNKVFNELKEFNLSLESKKISDLDHKIITLNQEDQTTTTYALDESMDNGKNVENNFKNLLEMTKQSTENMNETKKVDKHLNLHQTNEQKINKEKDKLNKNSSLKNAETKAAASQQSTKKVTDVKLEDNKVNQQTDETVINIKDTTTKNQTMKQGATKFKTIVKNNNVMKQINEKVEIKTLANKNEIEIKLKPDALGKMKITLSSESSKLAAKILVENNTVQNYLENNLNELKTTLAAKGLTVDKLNIETENKSTNDQYNQNSNNEFNQFNQDQRHSRNKNRQLLYNQFNNLEAVEGELEINEFNRWNANEYYSRGFEYFA